MTTPHWRQTTITFADPDTAEQVAIDHLAPILTEAETRNFITCWFYVRKGGWRLRYLPAADTAAAERYVSSELEQLMQGSLVHGAVAGIYEPETHAFGGPMGMDTAHQLWHHDSRHLLTRSPDAPVRDRELSIVLCTTMMRAAGLDWYEQGDVWARVADHRNPPQPALVKTLLGPVRRLLTVDPASLTHQAAPLAAARPWFEAYTAAGGTLNRLNQTGRLQRGIRATLTHHVIFAWNRRSIPGLHQAALATAARTIIFGHDPTCTGFTAGGEA